MGIAQKTNLTLEFEWESEEQPGEHFFVKYHSPDGNPLLSVSEDGIEWFNFPFNFFIEAIDHVSSQLRLLKQPSAPQPPRKTGFKQPQVLSVSNNGGEATIEIEGELNERTRTVAHTGLPMPNVHRTTDENGTLEPMEVADIEPLQNLSALGAFADRVSTTSPVVKTSAKKLRQKAQDEVINRPVIRGVDESTSRALRGANESRAIRKRHGD